MCSISFSCSRTVVCIIIYIKQYILTGPNQQHFCAWMHKQPFTEQRGSFWGWNEPLLISCTSILWADSSPSSLTPCILCVEFRDHAEHRSIAFRMRYELLNGLYITETASSRRWKQCVTEMTFREGLMWTSLFLSTAQYNKLATNCKLDYFKLCKLSYGPWMRQ